MDFPLLKIHNMILTEIGVEDKSYLETQNLQTKFCGGIKGFTNFFTLPDGVPALLMANYYNKGTFSVNSTLYRWVEGEFSCRDKGL